MARNNISADGKFRIDDEVIFGIDISEAPSNFNNIEWDTTSSTGWIGFNDGITPNQSITSTDEIETIVGVSYQTLLSRRTAKKAEMEAESNE